MVEVTLHQSVYLASLPPPPPDELRHADWKLVAKASHIMRGIDSASEALQPGKELLWHFWQLFVKTVNVIIRNMFLN